MKEADPYLEQFKRLEDEAAGQPSWLYPIRKAGIARFSDLGFPTVRHEDWRFTNVAPIANLPFRPTIEEPARPVSAADLARFTFAALEGSRLVFVDGHFSEELSSIQAMPDGVRVSSLAAAIVDDGGLVQKHLAHHIRGDGDGFAALNTAFFRDGAFIHAPAGKVIEKPIHLLFVSTGAETGLTAHPRNLIVADRGSQLTVIESYVSLADAACLTNCATEFIGGEGAVVEHVKFQDESTEAYHIGNLHAQLGRGCNYAFHSIALGGRIARTGIRAVLNGEGVECVLNGVYLTKDQQITDHHMVVEHAKPHCNSHEYFNGILDDRSKGVFHGRILVHQEAQKTDAKQTNKNLLLSDSATIDTKPQLEIYADDVKCTHGATVGQLNEDSIFYLRARGIGLETARRMLIHSFAGEITDRIRNEPAREELDRLIWDRLEENHLIAGKQP